MSYTQYPNFLRAVLLVDAATCAVSGIAMSLGADLFGKIMHLPPEVLLYPGLSLFPVAAFIAFVATREAVSTPAVWIVIVGNGFWLLGSLWLMLGGAVAPNALGTIYIVVQAGAIAALTALECKGVSQLPATA